MIVIACLGGVIAGVLLTAVIGYKILAVLLVKPRQTDKQGQPEVLGLDARIEKQLRNMFNYDGSGRGQEDIE